MRVLLDILIVVMLLAILAGVLMHQRGASEEMRGVTEARHALATLQSRAVYHAALAGAETDGRVVFPRELDPSWFGQQLPANALVEGQRPWIDVAPAEDVSDHPPDPVISRPDQASFWYNPTRGVFRARVPQQVTDRQTLELYNLVNNAALAELPRSLDELRTPIVMQLPTQETVVRASPDRQAVQRITDSTPEPATTAATPAAEPEAPAPATRSLRDLSHTNP